MTRSETSWTEQEESSNRPKTTTVNSASTNSRCSTSQEEWYHMPSTPRKDPTTVKSTNSWQPLHPINRHSEVFRSYCWQQAKLESTGHRGTGKGQNWIIQFNRITRASCSTTARYVRKLYLSITVPRMLYAADIFLTPQQKVGKKAGNDKPKQAIVNKLASIQRQAAIMITGAMKTTATDILDIMAGLLLFHILVNKHWHRAALWLATLPHNHPLHKPVENTAKRLVKCHSMPLHNLMHTFDIQPQKVETIEAVRQDTKWKPNIKMHITKNKENAIREVQMDTSDIKVFIDGSGIEGRIGVAAVLYWQGWVKTHLQYKLGLQKQHTVYEGEGIATVLGG